MRIRFALIVPFIFVAITGCIGSVETSPQLVMESMWGGETIDGVVRNVGETNADCVYVEFTLENDTGSIVSLVSAQGGPIKAGGSWEFQLDGSASGVTKVRNSALRAC